MLGPLLVFGPFPICTTHSTNVSKQPLSPPFLACLHLILNLSPRQLQVGLSCSKIKNSIFTLKRPTNCSNFALDTISSACLAVLRVSQSRVSWRRDQLGTFWLHTVRLIWSFIPSGSGLNLLALICFG